ncbi:AEC family transporter [Ancylobacter defluvii]|uniref:Transporter n=1 Tax=Ancylobacter defluvii TaxID=1282440 RepID=A0A9W6JXH2_9HYPH|nr:AEC family transporter [Ancylobacter defluvii]MBS7586385.1 AEC family transporter [Ancylobacter defluvii]GLK85666.1 transporter [Ancylobacter defluvii]
MAGVLGALVPVFLIIALGALLKRVLLTEASHWIALEKLTYFVLFPALIIVSIARADLGGVAVLEVGIALLLAILGLSAALMVLRRPLSRALSLTSPSYTSLFQGSVRWNSYIGLAVSSALAGPKGLAVAAVGLAVMIPVLNILSVVVLARHGARAGAEPPKMLAQIARNPYVWSCVVGALLNEINVVIPAVLMTFVDILGRSSLALGLLVVGAGLRLDSLHRARAATFLSCFLKLVLLPTAAIALGLALGLRQVDLLVVAIAASVPSAPNGYVLARQMGGDAPLLAEMLTVQMVFATITMPLAVSAANYLSS